MSQYPHSLITCKRVIYLLGVMLLTTTIHITPAVGEEISVFLLGGQSNMRGNGLAGQLPDTIPNPQEDVLFYYYGNNSLVSLRTGGGTNFGPEITFGRNIADAYPDTDFALLKHAEGGTALTDAWDPNTGASYTRFQSTVQKGLDALVNAGHTYKITGMLWTQGERDAKMNRTTAQYQADLVEFIASIRTKYGKDLPFFLSRLSSKQTSIDDEAPGQLEAIRMAQANVATADPNVYMIDTDAFGMGSDNLHFNTDGQLSLGEAFATSYIQSVPEPNTLSLMGAGITIMLLSGVFRRKMLRGR